VRHEPDSVALNKTAALIQNKMQRFGAGVDELARIYASIEIARQCDAIVGGWSSSFSMFIMIEVANRPASGRESLAFSMASARNGPCPLTRRADEALNRTCSAICRPCQQERGRHTFCERNNTMARCDHAASPFGLGPSVCVPPTPRVRGDFPSPFKRYAWENDMPALPLPEAVCPRCHYSHMSDIMS
jgi:hypothetical protein